MNDGQTAHEGTGLVVKKAPIQVVRSPHADASAAADVAVMFLIGLLFFLLLCFVWGAVALARRRASMQGAEVDDGEDVQSGRLAKTTAKDSELTQEWERDVDWWKSKNPPTD